MPDGDHNVVIVDPDATARADFRVALARGGFRVVCAGDSPAALRLTSRYNPDTVVTEINLPTLDGFRLAERLRHQPLTKDVGIVAVTSYAGDDLARRAAEVGIDAVVRKPWRADHLLRRVRESHQVRANSLQTRQLLLALREQVSRSRELLVSAQQEMASGQRVLDALHSALGGDALDEREQALLVEADGARDVMIADAARGEQLFEVLLERYDDHPLLYYKRGEAFRSIGMRKLAHQDFLTAAERLPEGTWRARALSASMRTRSHHERPKN